MNPQTEKPQTTSQIGENPIAIDPERIAASNPDHLLNARLRFARALQAIRNKRAKNTNSQAEKNGNEKQESTPAVSTPYFNTEELKKGLKVTHTPNPNRKPSFGTKLSEHWEGIRSQFKEKGALGWLTAYEGTNRQAAVEYMTAYKGTKREEMVNNSVSFLKKIKPFQWAAMSVILAGAALSFKAADINNNADKVVSGNPAVLTSKEGDIIKKQLGPSFAERYLSGGKIKIPETAQAISVGDQKGKIAPTEATVAALTQELQTELTSNPKISQAEAYTGMIAEGKIGKPENITPAQKALKQIGEIRARQQKDAVNGQRFLSGSLGWASVGMMIGGFAGTFKDSIKKRFQK
jgi:hypothetical protein